MSIEKTKCCATHTKEKEKSGECCQINDEQDRANDLSFENNGDKQKNEKNE
jgi:hypothetical protein